VTDDQPASEQPKTDPVQFVVSLTPEQNEARLKQAPKAAPPPPQQMEVGGTGTATVSFTDVNGTAVNIASSEWSSTGPVTVTASDTDPTSATLAATAPGPATITADIVSDGGLPAEAVVTIMVIETGTPATGKIDLVLQPPVAKAK
jgi:hypothetical protein